MKKQSKHNKLCDLVKARFESSPVFYDYGAQYLEYPKGEIDLVYINKGNIIYTEVKSRFTPKQQNKAQKQLKRMKEYYDIEGMRVFCFEAYGTKNGIDIRRYKPCLKD